MNHRTSSLGLSGTWTLFAIGLAVLGAVACGSDDDPGPSSPAGGSGGTGVGATGGTGGATGGTGGATGGTGGATGGTGGATGGTGGATGGTGGATGGTGGATGGTGGTGGTSGGGGDPGFVIGVDGIAAFDSLSTANKDALKIAKVFFHHMSVGENLMMGFNHWSPPWVAGTNSLGFVFQSVSGASDFDSKTLGNKAFGFNGNPHQKITDFQNHVLGMGIGAKVDVAGFKYCYNDLTVDITSNGDDVISAYQAAFGQIEGQTTGVAFFHVTTPLQPANQWQTVENNGLREKFATFLRSTYAGGRHVVFDLQAIESTKANGDSCKQGAVPVLCGEWAGDNDGHLNDAGSTRAAKAFLFALHVARGL
jgi:hypothetical protein